ncbi:hypothetical protein J6590_026474 [Homalodisca vitripennis]|nr:hypothetical protein J6590_026474 [Homalodisca vitripennis]
MNLDKYNNILSKPTRPDIIGGYISLFVGQIWTDQIDTPWGQGSTRPGVGDMDPRSTVGGCRHAVCVG